MPIFEPPMVDDVPRVLPDTRGPARLLMRHYSSLRRGHSVVLVGGHYATVDNPTTDQLVAAGEEGSGWFLGGHLYEVDDDVALALQADGYDIHFVQWQDLTGTWGSYASDTWELIG